MQVVVFFWGEFGSLFSARGHAAAAAAAAALLSPAAYLCMARQCLDMKLCLCVLSR
jgi:hypothetical protein